MDEAKASWNTFYQTKDGFECQVTLRDEEEANLAERAKNVMASISKNGGVPLRRKGYVPEDNGPNNDAGENGEENHEKPEKTYVDQRGMRRCNLKLRNGKVCASQVTQREGRYGQFWSCPRYKEHAA